MDDQITMTSKDLSYRISKRYLPNTIMTRTYSNFFVIWSTGIWIILVSAKIRQKTFVRKNVEHSIFVHWRMFLMQLLKLTIFTSTRLVMYYTCTISEPYLWSFILLNLILNECPIYEGYFIESVWNNSF